MELLFKSKISSSVLKVKSISEIKLSLAISTFKDVKSSIPVKSLTPLPDKFKDVIFFILCEFT